MSAYRLPRHVKTRLDAVWNGFKKRSLETESMRANQRPVFQIMTTDSIRIFVQSAVYRQIRIFCYEAGLNGYSHRIVTLLLVVRLRELLAVRRGWLHEK
jgi:hypothetical protein